MCIRDSAVDAALTPGNLSEWTASWANQNLLKGAYILRVVARDDDNEVRYSDDPTNLGGVITLSGNTCGLNPPNIQKSAEPASVDVGEVVTFTIALSNTLGTAYTVSNITDTLPSGFKFGGTTGGTLTPSTSPSANATGTIAWTFSPAASVGANSTKTLVYTATAGTVPGTYANRATAKTTTLLNPGIASALVEVGAPALTFAKSVTPLSVEPGDYITYTLTYANDTTVAIHNIVISDTLPTGTTYKAGSATHSGSLVGGDTVVWSSLGDLEPGETGYTVSYVVQVDDPYGGANPLENTAVIDSDDTDPTNSNTTNTFVDAPFPDLQFSKSTDELLVDPGELFTYTLTYVNVGDAQATGVVITDTIPEGLNYVAGSANPSASYSSATRTLTWNIGTVAASTSEVNVTFAVTVSDPFAYTSPVVNLAAMKSDQLPLKTAKHPVGVSKPVASEVCEIYYYHAATTNVGAAGTQKTATTAVPTGPTQTTSSPDEDATTIQELARFYTDPAFGADGVNFTQVITGYMWHAINLNAGTDLHLLVDLYDYNPTNGATTRLGSRSYYTTAVDLTAKVPFAFSVVGDSVPSNHRILTVFSHYKSSGNVSQLDITYDSPANDSHFRVCRAAGGGAPAVVLSKKATPDTVSPGSPITYTLSFANGGEGTASGAVISDTLPAGVTFDSATLNGSPVTPNFIGGRNTFTVSVGNIGIGGEGELLVRVTVDPDVTGSTLLNLSLIHISEPTRPY